MKKNFVFIMLCSVFLVRCTEPETLPMDLSSGTSLYRLAENMKQRGDYGSAIRLYRQSLLVAPDVQETQTGLAEALFLDQQFKESRSLVERLLVKSPQDQQALNLLGRISIAQHDPETCLKAYQTLVEASSAQDGLAMNGLAVCYDLAHKHRKAQDFYLKAMQLDPDSPFIKANYGLSLALTGKTKEAIKILSTLPYQKQDNIQSRHNLAVSYGLSGDLKKAEELFSKDLKPEDLKRNMDLLKDLQASSLKEPKRG